MRHLLTLVGLALALHACAPCKPDFTPPAAQACFDVKPSFNQKMLQHVHYLNAKYKHGHAHAIAYIYDNSHRARRVQSVFGIPAEITLAVGMLESDKGGSNIAIQARNHFGIKEGDDWEGPVFVCQRGQTWRAYHSIEASYMGFGQYLAERVPGFLDAPSVEALAATGYAGHGKKAARYAQHLNTIITRYELRDLFTH